MLGVALPEEYTNNVMNVYNRKREGRRKKKEAREKCIIDFNDSDADFAFIAGYTDGGAPYGITWEEQAEIDKYENQVLEDGSVVPGYRAGHEDH